MPTTYDKAPVAVREEIKRILTDHYPELIGAGVRVGCLVAEKRDAEGSRMPGSAVTLHGYPCHAVIKVNSLKDRAEGKPDATIVLDGNNWEDLPEPRQTAILHHELHHLVLKREGNKPTGPIEADDLGRPKLKLRLHDWQLGGFSTIAKRYAEFAPEVEYFRHALDQHGQYLLYEERPDAEKPARPRAVRHGGVSAAIHVQ